MPAAAAAEVTFPVRPRSPLRGRSGGGGGDGDGSGGGALPARGAAPPLARRVAAAAVARTAARAGACRRVPCASKRGGAGWGARAAEGFVCRVRGGAARGQWLPGVLASPTNTTVVFALHFCFVPPSGSC